VCEDVCVRMCVCTITAHLCCRVIRVSVCLIYFCQFVLVTTPCLWQQETCLLIGAFCKGSITSLRLSCVSTSCACC